MYISIFVVFITCFLSFAHGQSQQSDLLDDSTSKCEPLNTQLIPLCAGIAYNETRFPNFVRQRTQSEATTDTNLYMPLVRMNCSPVLKLFLCTLYAPPCVSNYSVTLRPCREMCLKARAGCEQVMKGFQFAWPDYIDCWRFPSFNGADPCITDENYSGGGGQQQPATTLPTFQRQPNIFNLLTPNQQQQQQPGGQVSASYIQQLYAAAMAAAAAAAASLTTPQSPLASLPSIISSQQQPTSSMVHVKFVCPQPLQIVDMKKVYTLTLHDEQVNDCGMPCDNTLFDSDEIRFARMWVLVWSALCFASTLFTMMTFLIDRARFNYPEKPIIFISGCYMFVSLAYIFGSNPITGNSVVCQPQNLTFAARQAQLLVAAASAPGSTSSSVDSLRTTRDFLVQGTESYSCTALFMIIYLFGMASAIWWVILTLTWFLAAGLKWGHEAIDNVSVYFHIAAWTIPTLMMIGVLVLRKVDADVLSGVCYTGIRNMNMLRGFVLTPLCFFLVLGTCFLLAGFWSLFRIRTVMKHEGTHTDKLEKFMVRIGVFSILYMVPAIVVICCYFYEQSSYNKWIESWLTRNFIEFNLMPGLLAMMSSGSDTSSSSATDNSNSYVVFSLFMLKYAMLLVVGISSSFWIWSSKTISSWRQFFNKILDCSKTDVLV